jgi:hypothetical protein
VFNRRAAAGTHSHLPGADLGESPLWPTAAIITAATLYTTLPVRFVAGPSAGVFGSIRWIVPALTVLLLAVLLASLPKVGLGRAFGISTHRLHLGRHIASLGVISLLSAANAVSIYFLVHALINGAHVVAAPLLRAALHLWSVNVRLVGVEQAAAPIPARSLTDIVGGMAGNGAAGGSASADGGTATSGPAAISNTSSLTQSVSQRIHNKIQVD